MQNEKKTNEKEGANETGRFFKNIGEKLRGRDERQVRARLLRLTRFFLVAAASYFISCAEAPFGSFPFAIALVCSAGKNVFAVTAGLLPRFIFGELPALYIFVCFATLMIRILSELWPRVLAQSSDTRAMVKYKEMPPEKRGVGADRRAEEKGLRLLCEPLYVKALCAAIGGVLCGLFLLIEQDYSFYSLWAALSLAVISPLAVAALGGVFGEERYRREWYYLLSLCLTVSLCTYSSVSNTLLGMPMAPFLAMLFTLYLCSERGMLYGLCVAATCGASFDLRYMLLLILSAVLFCLVSSLKRNAGLAAVCAVVVVWCYYIGGAEGLVSVLPPMLLAIPFYMLADKYREMMISPIGKDRAGGIYFAEAVTEKNKNQAFQERLSALSEAFSSLSENFYKLSDRFRRPDALGIRRIADSAFEDVCSGCRNREVCWGAEYAETLEAIRCVASSLHTAGGADVTCLPDEFSARCPNKEKIVAGANSSVAAATEKMIGGKIGFFSSNYDDITALLRDALESDGEEYVCDMEAGEKIYEYLHSLSLDVSGVVVYGKRCRHVVVKGVSLGDGIGGAEAAQICREAERIIGAPLTEPIFEVCRDGNLMLMYSRPHFSAVCAHGRIPSAEMSGEDRDIYVDPFSSEGDISPCGDTTEAFITDTSYFYSLISDGMGSGDEAAFTSGVCAMFIEKMLSAGNRADITLRMLNNVIRSENMGCGSECSATVDLLELDLMSGVASFIKSGAAPTYIARDGTVYKISSRTMPVGIIKDADARITKFDTKAGDVIVMISDGCSPDSDDCTWLVEYLCGKMPFKLDKEDPSSFCEKLKDELLDEAVKNYPAGRERDDISVSVTLIR